MPAIITLTFNPCIDKSVDIPNLTPEKKMHCSSMRYDPGGGGINVARGIKRLGGDVMAIYPCGGWHGELLTKMLNKEKVVAVPVAIEENLRESWMVFEVSTKKQYRFIMPGPKLNKEEWEEFLSTLESVKGVKFMVISGSMPPDFPKDIFDKIGSIAEKKKTKIIVDTSGQALKLALLHGVYMIKPNLNELASLIVEFGLTRKSAAGAAKEIVERKLAEVVVVSLGAAGAIVVDANTTLEIKSPPVNKKSTVGAGDSMVAGIVFALDGNRSLKQATEFGVACGTAATMNQGTELFHPDEAENLYTIMQKEMSYLAETDKATCLFTNG